MRKCRGAHAIVVAIAGALALSSCVTGDTVQRPRIGETAPAYQAETLSGETVTLESFRGRVVLLNLWATWCAPCRHETPFLQSLFSEHRDRGFDVVGVSMDNGDQVGLIRDFIDEFDVEYTILHDPGMRGMDIYHALGLPATFLIDREGIVRWMRFGPVDETDRDFLSALENALS